MPTIPFNRLLEVQPLQVLIKLVLIVDTDPVVMLGYDLLKVSLVTWNVVTTSTAWLSA